MTTACCALNHANDQCGARAGQSVRRVQVGSGRHRPENGPTSFSPRRTSCRKACRPRPRAEVTYTTATISPSPRCALLDFGISRHWRRRYLSLAIIRICCLKKTRRSIMVGSVGERSCSSPRIAALVSPSTYSPITPSGAPVPGASLIKPPRHISVSIGAGREHHARLPGYEGLRSQRRVRPTKASPIADADPDYTSFLVPRYSAGRGCEPRRPRSRAARCVPKSMVERACRAKWPQDIHRRGCDGFCSSDPLGRSCGRDRNLVPRHCYSGSRLGSGGSRPVLTQFVRAARTI